MNCDADVIVVGGGPAGSAAAIWAAASGLSVKLLERSAFPRHRPGETLHPGLASILRQLGVEQRVETASTARHRGQWVAWGGPTAFQAFGSDANGAWHGYQILRERLDAILLARARELGVEVLQPGTAAAPLIEGGRVIGVRSRHAMRARFVIDAGGGRGWLRRHLRLALDTASPPLHAIYGYCEGELDGTCRLPFLNGDGQGWTWIAPIAPRRFHWTRLALTAADRNIAPPLLLASLRQIDRVRGADVTWRHVPSSAGRGYFLAGDAAFVLDPASSHGVLGALMSGMMAAHAIRRIADGAVDEDSAAASYRAWMRDRFRDDLRQLATFYRQLEPSPDWVTDSM